jgi:predicted nucleic acid-binding protein
VITAVDSNILIDILGPDPRFGAMSRDWLKHCVREGAIIACDVVWTEVLSVYGARADQVRRALDKIGLAFVPMTMEAAEIAAGLWFDHRRVVQSKRHRVVADFLIGGHALVQADRLLTRDRGFYRGYFGELKMVDPTKFSES